MSKRPTIQDVADRAGVSRSAISKVLRNAYGISAEMRGYSCIGMRDKGHLMAAADALHVSCECLIGPLLHIFLAQDDGRGMRGGNPLEAC